MSSPWRKFVDYKNVTKEMHEELWSRHRKKIAPLPLRWKCDGMTDWLERWRGTEHEATSRAQVQQYFEAASAEVQAEYERRIQRVPPIDDKLLYKIERQGSRVTTTMHRPKDRRT